MSLYIEHRPNDLSEVKGNEEIVQSLEKLLSNQAKCPHVFLFHGPTGCVDCDTEFLTPFGWKKISAWDNDLVMQYNEDGSSEFVQPLYYIKQKSNFLFHFKTKYGLDQCLSHNHRFIYFLPDKNSKIHTKPFQEIIEQHAISKHGFSGKIKTTFSPKINSRFNLNDDLLRVQVMFIADGTIRENRKNGCLNLKKIRKIQRAEALLKKARIPFDKYIMGNGYVRFYFVPPLRDKEFDFKYYSCNKAQLSVITNEVLHWDGNCKDRFSSTSKNSADFIQYAFSSCDYRATIYHDVREGRKTTYNVCITKRIYVGISGSINKVLINEYATKDGYEYCFSVPSTYLILRRNDKIFITGNCGKTTFGRIVANSLGCVGADYREVDSADFRGIDTIREIRKNSMYKPLEGPVRVWLIDEAHKMTNDAQNAALKLFEDTPPHVYFILCTTEPQKLLPTLRGRCSQFQVKQLTENQLLGLLRSVCKKEGEVVPKEVLQTIVQESQGHPRNALTILEQVLSVEPELRLEMAQKAIIEQGQAVELCRELLKKTSWSSIAAILKTLKDQDPEMIRRVVLGYCQSILLNGDNSKVGLIMEEFMEPTYNSGFPQIVFACYSIIKNS